MIRGLRTVVFPVDDLKRAKAFYTALLGYEPYFDEPFYVGFEVEGYELGLSPDHQASTRGSRAYWGVEDVEASIARALSLGASQLSDARDVGGGIIIGAVRDPSGNTLGFVRNPDFRGEVGSGVAAVGQQLEQPIVRTERVHASAREIFDVWTTSQGMSSWLTRAHIELRVGGPFELYFDASQPKGKQGSEGCRVLAYQPPRLLAFTWNAPPHLETRGQRTWVLLELDDHGSYTDVTLTHTGWPRVLSGDWPKTYVYFEDAWTRVLQALGRHFGG
ncbi:MAG: hypothetical protein EP330_07400 [Deltaproteobacteria bacterium]|nr:MAG: hypothetical protein EP330_07400 [Deltaproteobacteria bacterium]